MADGSDVRSFDEEVADLKSLITEGITQAASLAKAAQETADGLKDDVKKFGSEKADGKEKLSDLSTKWADQQAEMQELKQQLDSVLSQVAKMPISKGDKSDAVRKAALTHYHRKHIVENTDPEDAASWDESMVSEDDIKAYAVATRAMDKIFRQPVSVKHAEAMLSQEEQAALKALSTDQGNTYWLRPELSDRVVACYEEPTDLQSVFDSLNISRGRVVLPIDEDVEDIAQWRCEIDCNESGSNFKIPGTLSIEPEELAATIFATHTFLEDSEIDIPGWIVTRAGRAFSQKRNRTFVQGNTETGGKIIGLTKDGAFDTIDNGAGLDTPNLKFSWQDLVIMSTMLIDRYSANASWMLSRTALASMLTMADNENRPIFQPQVIQGGGLPALMGKSMRIVTQFPEYSDPTTGAPIANARPIAYGDWQQAYMVVNRIQLSIERDPYAAPKCGVAWHFRQRFGGGPLCSNAAIFLKIAN